MRRRATLAVVLSLFPTLAVAQPRAVEGDPSVRRYDGYSSVRVTVRSSRELLAVNSLMDQLLSEGEGVGTFDVLMPPGGTARLSELGIAFQVLSPNIQALIDAESARLRAVPPGGGTRGIEWFADYKDLDTIHAYLDTLAAAKPGLATVQTIGTSLQARAMKAIRITAPGAPPTRPAVIFHGGQHAREWITPMTVMYFADQLVSGYGTDPRITAILDRLEVIIVPVMNPDGYSYTWTSQRLWRKNRRGNIDGSFGVDLNRNWGYQWGGEGASTTPGSDTYRGTAAFSEPETQVMRDFITANPRIRAHIDFHSYSQLILSPWAFTSALPADAAIFSMLNAELKSTVESMYGTQYQAGPTYTTIYPASGASSDWTYGQHGILGWGWELRDTGQYGFVLPPEQIVPTAKETYAAVLGLCEYVALPFVYSFPTPLPASVSADTPTDVTVTILPRSGAVQNGTPMLRARAGTSGPFASSALVSLGNNLYKGTLPAASCNDVVQYYFEASSTDGQVLRSPVDAPITVHQASVYSTIIAYSNPCESSAGWVVGAAGDNATAGIWGLADPSATVAQPGDDHTASGTQCWVTDGRAGATAGTYDVDSGTTTLTSPTFSAVETDPEFVGFDALLSYARWYSNDQGSAPNADSMPVLISNNNGASWVTLEDVSENAGQWVVKTFRIADYLAPTAQMKLRFQARDLGSGSVVEAAVDDLLVTVQGCPRRPADFNGDGFIDLEDFTAFVLAFEAGDDSADFDKSGFVDTDDFDSFVRAFEEG